MNILEFFTKTKKQILVIDDESAINDLLAVALRSAGYRVFTAGNADEGLEILSAKNIDLIITDIRMPFKNGIEFIRELKQEDEHRHTPVFFMSGYYSPKEMQRLRDKFKDIEVFNKPIQISKLVRKVNTCIQGGTDVAIEGR